MTLNREELLETRELALQMSLDTVTGMLDEAAPNGMSYFDEDFANESEFVLWFLGLRDYSDPQWGQHLDLTAFLPQIAPALWSKWVTRYQRAVSAHVNGGR